MKVFLSKGTRFQMFNNLINVMKWASLFLILVLVSIASASEGEDAQYLQMRRTACLVLSRVHSNSQKEVIEQTIQALQPTDQNKYIGKLYAVAVLKCEESITQSEVQEFYVENSNFDPSNYFYLLEGIDYAEIAGNLETNREQEAVVKFAKKYDEQMEIRKEEQEAKKEEETGADERYEMKFLGLSIRDLPTSAKYIYVSIFAAIVVGALWYGISQLDNGKAEKQGNKRRRSPKKDSSAKKE